MKTRSYNKADHTFPFYDTFPAFFEGITRTYGERPALSWFTRKQEEQTLTYSELTEKIGALRRAILNLGIAPGSHVAIVSENSADWIIAFSAIVSCGCVAVCVDTEQSDDSIRDMLCRSDSVLAFLSPTFQPICLPLLGTQLKHIVLMGTRRTDERVLLLGDLIERGHELPDVDCPPILPEQTAELVFTSGTTSRSKMVLLSHKAVMQNCCEAGLYVNLHQRVFTSLPFYHAYGLNLAVFSSLQQGTHLYINGDLKTTMRDLHLANPDTMFTVPLMVEAIHNQIWLTAEKAEKADGLRKLMKMAAFCKKCHLPIPFKTLEQLKEKALGTLRLMICGGAHLSKELSEEFDLLGVQMLQGYGITECSPLISVNCSYANKMGSVGPAMPGMELRLEDGEVCVRGVSVMQGYYKNPEETAAALSEDGWFRTGDLGYLDKDGFLYLTGRKKNLIVFKNGKKISPEKLEELIAAIPIVKEVLVTGTANGMFADDVKLTASIYPDPQRTENLSSYEILEQLQREVDKINDTLPVYQQIQLVNIREKEFSKTGTKKIKRDGN